MEAHKDILHQFDLTGLKVGDAFIGCTRCWFQLPPGCVTVPECHCGNRLSLLTVTPIDVREEEQ